MASRPVKIYSKTDTPRLRYIAGVVLGEILGLSWEITSDKRKIGKFPLINYSTEHIEGSFKISPVPLLFEKGLAPVKMIVDDWNGLPVFFQTSQDSDLPFDIFAASFYLVSRYEEYLEYIPDKFGRFPASSSLAFKHGFLDIPIVDIWAKEMSKRFVRKFPSLTFKRHVFNALLSIDIDQPFAYLGKSLIRSIGGIFRDIKNKSGNVSDRYNIVARGEKDPYEVFDYIFENIKRENCDVRFFIPVGDHSEFDKNPSWRNEEYRKLIGRVAGKFKTGLHPSYFASDRSSVIKTEKTRLNKILKKEVTMSRFHYIRFIMPRTFRDLYSAGILEDYSMGYPDEPGFRAGIARPYYFYDVFEDRQLNLKIFPFQIMDGTLYNYKKLDTAGAEEVILKLINETKKVGGLFVSIWHNTSLLDNEEWNKWRRVFEFMLKNQAR
jgi:uncharacterized protein DUF7033